MNWYMDVVPNNLYQAIKLPDMNGQNLEIASVVNAAWSLPAFRLSADRQVCRRRLQRFELPNAIFHQERHGEAPGDVHIQMAVHQPHPRIIRHEPDDRPPVHRHAHRPPCSSSADHPC